MVMCWQFSKMQRNREVVVQSLSMACLDKAENTETSVDIISKQHLQEPSWLHHWSVTHPQHSQCTTALLPRHLNTNWVPSKLKCSCRESIPLSPSTKPPLLFPHFPSFCFPHPFTKGLPQHQAREEWGLQWNPSSHRFYILGLQKRIWRQARS